MELLLSLPDPPPLRPPPSPHKSWGERWSLLISTLLKRKWLFQPFIKIVTSVVVGEEGKLKEEEGRCGGNGSIQHLMCWGRGGGGGVHQPENNSSSVAVRSHLSEEVRSFSPKRPSSWPLQSFHTSKGAPPGSWQAAGAGLQEFGGFSEICSFRAQSYPNPQGRRIKKQQKPQWYFWCCDYLTFKLRLAVFFVFAHPSSPSLLFICFLPFLSPPRRSATCQFLCAGTLRFLSLLKKFAK